jgi:enoyl-CoA hydratase/carnithine racemase
MRFASHERAVFGQPEVGVGAVPGAAQYLTRLLGRGRILEVRLSADDFPADLAEHCGWINRALPDAELTGFVNALADRMSRIPLASVADTKRRVNDITLPAADAVGEDSRLFLQGMGSPVGQARLWTLFE